MIHPDFQRPGSGILDDGRVHPDVTAKIAATRGRGAELDQTVQQDVGGRLGASFADVRVHTDALASTLATAVQARAFTTGSDIYFASGEYRPQSTSGRELIAHELRHVQQQRGMPTTGDLVVSQPGDALEVDAERAARRM